MIHLNTIRVLFRAPDTLGLWGIPYEMRKDIGQEPRHLWEAARKRNDSLSDPGRYRGAGPFGPFVPPSPTRDWILIDERDPDMRAWLSALDDVPGNPCEWCECRLATDDVLNTVRRHDELGRIEHQPGDVVRVLFGYRGNQRFAPDGSEGIYVVKSRMDGGRGSDYKLIRYSDIHTLANEGVEYRLKLADDLPWDLIAHASRLVRFYYPE